MKNWHGHRIVFGAVVLSSAVPPPTLNSIYIEVLHSPALGGAVGVMFNYSTFGDPI